MQGIAQIGRYSSKRSTELRASFAEGAGSSSLLRRLPRRCVRKALQVHFARSILAECVHNELEFSLAHGSSFVLSPKVNIGRDT